MTGNEALELFETIEQIFKVFGASNEFRKEYARRKRIFEELPELDRAITPPPHIHPKWAYIVQDIRIWFSKNYQIPDQPVHYY